MKKTIQSLMFGMLLFGGVLALNNNAQAEDLNTDVLWGEDGTAGKSEVMSASALTETSDPRVMIANGVRIFLSFLGLVAVIIILMGGFKYMTAQGDDKKTEEAIKLIKTGFIGLAIILSAFGLATFIINQIGTALTTGT